MLHRLRIKVIVDGLVRNVLNELACHKSNCPFDLLNPVPDFSRINMVHRHIIEVLADGFVGGAPDDLAGMWANWHSEPPQARGLTISNEQNTRFIADMKMTLW